MNQREIKFRAWNGKKMYQVYGFNDQEIWGFLGEFGGQVGRLGNRNKVILMQFAGLLDKNGKGIYEGDIVNAEQKEIGEIVWSNTMFGWRIKFKDIELPILERFLEVIGNIYENPELLKQ